MKKYSYIIFFAVTLWSCGGGGGGGNTPTPTPTVENKAPSIPVLTTPTNNKLCIDNALTFEWNTSTDPENNAITYQIQVATNINFSSIVETKTTSSTNISISLEKGIAYYWRVKAIDSKSASSNYSSVFNFYTEGTGVINHLPFSPELVNPTLNAIEQNATVTLQWNGSDADTSDSLTYDVYFGMLNPPTENEKVSANQVESNFTTSLNSTTEYYWRIVVKDNNGGETIGQVWNFKTD
ncbi:SusE domain-containing protein [Lutibacter sp.]|uniref:glycoside hydrolase family 78 protein n=1 Tax=Lutibacter sp. TaxID=1925666 RepID=UPI0025BF345F|nr:SusE domain-containing protein [Lutibacter sp.]MCF6182699.1 SusE domain-containing protein [Lutibacter sp.]